MPVLLELSVAKVFYHKKAMQRAMVVQTNTHTHTQDFEMELPYSSDYAAEFNVNWIKQQLPEKREP